jgi:UrcA family protein
LKDLTMKMSNLVARSLMAVVSIAAAVAIFSAPAHASESDEINHVTVRFGDLDLSSPKDTKQLYMRLKGASETVCGDEEQAIDVRERVEISKCVKEAIEDAAGQINRPSLTALYDHHYPKEPLATAMRVSYAPRDNVSGYMTAELVDGQQYSGEYVEPGYYGHVDPSDPFWAQWCADGPASAAATCASPAGQKAAGQGRHEVVARMKDADGASLHCQFDLSHRSSGMAGGAEGKCQLPTGQTVEVDIPRV